MREPIKRRLLPWEKTLRDITKYDWMTAVGHHTMHKGSPRDLRIANVVMQKADAATGYMWASQQTIAELADVADERQVRASMQRLEESGALKKCRIADLQPDMIDVLGGKLNRNKRGVVYKIQKFWALEVFEGKATRIAKEPERLRKARELKRTAPVRCQRTAPVRSEQDSGSPAYTTVGNYTDIQTAIEGKQDLASTREGEQSNSYAQAKGRAA